MMNLVRDLCAAVAEQDYSNVRQFEKALVRKLSKQEQTPGNATWRLSLQMFWGCQPCGTIVPRTNPHQSQGQMGQMVILLWNSTENGSWFVPGTGPGPVCPRDGSCLSRTPSRPKCLCLLVLSCPNQLGPMKSTKEIMPSHTYETRNLARC